MRARAKDGKVSVQAVSGTHVVLLGMDVHPSLVKGLLGFAIERTDHTEGERRFLDNPLRFEANDVAAGDHSTAHNPVQEFVWGDYAVKPDHTYTYRVAAMKGSPERPRSAGSVEVKVSTENPDAGSHGVWLNRGVAASSAYERRFGNVNPADVANREAYRWLGRGLEEALTAFIGQAVDARWGLRAAMYEFKWPPVLHAFKVASDAGANVRIVLHAVSRKGDKTAAHNLAAIRDAQLGGQITRRTQTTIAHNKFVVLLRNGKPVAVWTGSTNITEGGIFGHANVGHVVRDARTARAFLDYWEALERDPGRPEMKAFSDPRPRFPAARPRASLTTVFSPRSRLDPLAWYVRLAESAKQGVFLTAAFGLTDELRPVFEEERRYLRYLLLDLRDGKIEAMRRDPSNVVAAGGMKGKGAFRKWISSKLQRLNMNVDYIHAKFMLVDPLTSDPIVITGSANWSDESVRQNDENMVVIRGDTRVADIYLTEFMRLFNHYRLPGRARSPHLDPGDGWARPFFERGSSEAKERLLFR